MITAVDTNILLDILVPNAPHSASSKTLLDEAHRQGSLILNEIVYAEVAARFISKGELDEFLRRTGIRLEPSLRESLYAASEAWRIYTSRRGQGLQCLRCGQAQVVNCSSCGTQLRARQHILADFLIGGHALKQADRLLTRDLAYYRTYFPALRLQER